MDLPLFTYNLANDECFETSDGKCSCCNKKRGYIYIGPMFGEEIDHVKPPLICPWCIADGSASKSLNVEFIGTGYHEAGDDTNVEFTDEFKFRTPSFTAWQQAHWWTHCGDAAVYQGAGGMKEIKAIGGNEGLDFFRVLAEDCGYETRAEQDEFLKDACGLDRDSTVYIFKCKKCGKCGGYLDFS